MGAFDRSQALRCLRLALVRLLKRTAALCWATAIPAPFMLIAGFRSSITGEKGTFPSVSRAH
jgi:hypothetical protein